MPPRAGGSNFCGGGDCRRAGGAVPGGRRTGDSVSETERLLQEITTWSVVGGGFIRRLLGG